MARTEIGLEETGLDESSRGARIAAALAAASCLALVGRADEPVGALGATTEPSADRPSYGNDGGGYKRSLLA